MFHYTYDHCIFVHYLCNSRQQSYAYLLRICSIMNVLLGDAWGKGLWCLTPFSTIFQLYRGGQFYGWRKPEFRRKSPTSRKSLTNFITYYYTSWILIRIYLLSIGYSLSCDFILFSTVWPLNRPKKSLCITWSYTVTDL